MVNESPSAQKHKGPSPQTPFRLRKNYGKRHFIRHSVLSSPLMMLPEGIRDAGGVSFPESISGIFETQMRKIVCFELNASHYFSVNFP
jgi:hypothetical protein